MFILELIGGFLGEVALEVFLLSVIELVFQSLHQQFRPAREARWWVAALGLVVLGALVGFGSTFVLRQRVMPGIGVPGVSLIAAPLIAAVAVWATARFALEPNGIEPTVLFTWWGGAIFAFAVAATRFVGIS